MLPTQSQHPWRATLRTVVAALVAILPALPTILSELGLGGLPWVAVFLAAIGAVTRVLAMPSVIAWVREYAKWLAPDAPPKENDAHRPPS